jgi:hypothetical protein
MYWVTYQKKYHLGVVKVKGQVAEIPPEEVDPNDQATVNTLCMITTPAQRWRRFDDGSANQVPWPHQRCPICNQYWEAFETLSDKPHWEQQKDRERAELKAKLEPPEQISSEELAVLLGNTGEASKTGGFCHRLYSRLFRLLTTWKG